MKLLIFIGLMLKVIFSISQPYRINTTSNNPNETSVAISRNNPDFRVAGANLSNIYISEDGGKSWEEKSVKSSLGFYGDPVIEGLQNGNFLLAHLAMNSEKSKPSNMYSGMDKIVIQNSVDQGHTWSDGAFTGLNGTKMQDKPWICQYPNGHVGVSWTEFDVYGSKNPEDKSRIQFSISNNNGLSFSSPITVSDQEGNSRDDDQTHEGATTAGLNDGTIGMSWAYRDTIWFDISTDGGKTWGKDQMAGLQPGGWVSDQDYFFRTNGLPFIQSDHQNTFYIVYTSSLGFNRSVIVFAVSHDRGKTWNHQHLKEIPGHAQYMPALTFDPGSKMGYIVFYEILDKEMGKTFTGLGRVKIIEFDQGGTLTRQGCLTPTPFILPGNRIFFGDYLDVDAYKGNIQTCWTQSDAPYDLNVYSFPLLQKFPLPQEKSDTSLAIAEGPSSTIWYCKGAPDNPVIVYRSSAQNKWKKMRYVKDIQVPGLFLLHKYQPGLEIGWLDKKSGMIKGITRIVER